MPGRVVGRFGISDTLTGIGYEVISTNLPSDDLDESVRITHAYLDDDAALGQIPQDGGHAELGVT